MFQTMTTEHIFPQVVVSQLAPSTSNLAGTLTAFQVAGGGIAVSAIDATYLGLSTVVGSASGVSGFYAARHFDIVPGYSEMVCICSVALQLGGLPPDAVAMAFATSADLSSGPNIGSGSVPTLWYPIEINCDNSRISGQAAFPVQNASNLASYFGLAVFGTFGSTAKALTGGFSLRQHLRDVPIFTPVK